MNDLVIDRVDSYFGASKNRAFRERVIESFKVFIDFLQANHLTTRILLESGCQPDEHTIIWQSDLTEEGLEVFTAAYYKWLGGLDRGKPIHDVSVMERALKKIRE